MDSDRTTAREGRRQIDHLHVSVAALSIRDDPLDLSDELTLAKAAVLYADRVTLLGPKVVLLSYVDRLARGTRSERDAILLRMLRELPQSAELFSQLDTLSREAGRLGATFAALIRGIGLAWLRWQTSGAIRPLADRTKYDEFRVAINAGVLTLDPLTKTGDPAPLDDVAAEMADAIGAAARASGMSPPREAPAQRVILERFVERLAAILEPDSQTEPLFDDNVRPLVDGLSHIARKMGVPLMAPPTEPAVATTLIGTVPTFPDAPMNEILGARRALRGALVRFRSAIMRFSAEVSATPGSAAFEQEIAALYRRDIAPALEELKETEADLRLDRELARHGLRSATEVTAGALALGAFHLIDAHVLAQALVAVAPAIGKVGSGIIEDHRAAHREERQNRFVFLHRLGKRLDG